MDSHSIDLNVNGSTMSLDVAETTPLIYVLRNDLKLKGTRFGCGLGQCGSCTVLVDGRAVKSCDLPVWAVVGRKITTIEGLGSKGALHALQQAFIDEQAMQCGYCTSGIIMTAAALLAHNPSPEEEEIRTALDGNLCRCGVHGRIVRAVQRAATLNTDGAPS